MTTFANEFDIASLNKLVNFINNTAIPSYQPVFKKFEDGYIKYCDQSASREEAGKVLLKIAKDGGIKLYSTNFAGEVTLDTYNHPPLMRLDTASQEVKDAMNGFANKYAEAHTYLKPIANNRHAPEPEHARCCVMM